MISLILKDTSGPLPTSTFEIKDGDIGVGILQLRHRPSKSAGFPEGFESHIYYEILEEYRNRGYGKQALFLGLQKAKEIGLTEVILTCLENNVASKKIIESNSGIIVDNKTNEGGDIVLKYKITL